jgi:hypothetical protein
MSDTQRAATGPRITIHGTQLPLAQKCSACIEHALQFDQPVPPLVTPNALIVVGRSVVGSYSCSRCRRGWSVSYSIGAAL